MPLRSESPTGARNEPDSRPASLLHPLLHALMFVAASAQSAIVPLLPRLSHTYGLSPAAGALLLAAPGLATLVISMPAGLLADRLGARRVTVGATVLMAATTLAQAAPSYPILVAGRLGFGLAYGIVWTTGVAWMSGSQGESGSPRLGAVATSAAVGMVAGPAIGGVMADVFGPWSPFVLIAAIALTLAPLLASQPVNEATATPTGSGSVRALVRLAPRQSGVSSCAFALALVGAVGGVTQLLVPMQLHHVGFTAGATGVAFSAAAGVYIVISGAVVKLGRRATTLRWLALAALALAVSLLPAAVHAGAIAAIGVLLLSTGPRAVLSTVAYPLATASAAAAELGDGVVIGLLNGAWAAGLVLAPLIAGAVEQLAGPQLAYLTPVAPGALAAAWLLRRGHPEAATAEHELAMVGA